MNDIDTDDDDNFIDSPPSDNDNPPQSQFVMFQSASAQLPKKPPPVPMMSQESMEEEQSGDHFPSNSGANLNFNSTLHVDTSSVDSTSEASDICAEGSEVQTHSLQTTSYNGLTGVVAGPAEDVRGVMRVPVRLNLADGSQEVMLLQRKNLKPAPVTSTSTSTPIVVVPPSPDSSSNSGLSTPSKTSGVSPEKKSFMRNIRRSISFSPSSKAGKAAPTQFSTDELPSSSPNLQATMSDPTGANVTNGTRSPGTPRKSLINKSKSVTSLDKTTKHTRQQRPSVSPMKQASHLTVKNIEAVSCIFKVTVDRITFPENKGLADKLREGTNIQVVFERGDRNVKSYERPVVANKENGSMEVVYDEALSLTLTMYRNPSTNKYHEKKGKLTLMQEKRKTKMKRLFSQPYKEIGTVQFDLAKVFEDYESVDRVLGVTQCPIPGTTIHVTLQPKVIGEDMAQFSKPRVDKEKGESYEGEYDKDRKHGQGKMTYADGSYYEGSWRQDVMHGRGKFVSADQEVYEGEYEDGLKHGRGHTTFPDGSLYAGEYQHGTVAGWGKFIADGDIYEGEWEDNMEHGKGKLIYATGDVYEGDFREDMKQGDGVLTTHLGDKYTGHFQDDCISGMGRYEWASGDAYTGLWAKGMMNGYGEYVWKNGDVYRGTWQDNKKHGEGEFIAANGQGDRFKGTFENDMKLFGKYEFSDGDVYEGGYKDDMQEGYGSMTYGDGDSYDGSFHRDMKHGSGVYRFADGSVYDGEYFENEMHGTGKYKSHLGDAYDGEYEHNCRNGFGKYYYRDDSYYEGHWRNNLKHGEGFYQWPNGNSFTGEFVDDKKADKGQYSVVYRVE